jgi:hypothetical protein
MNKEKRMQRLEAAQKVEAGPVWWKRRHQWWGRCSSGSGGTSGGGGGASIGGGGTGSRRLGRRP